MALVARALTSVAMAKSHLSIPSGDTTQDARVELWVNAATGRMEAWTDRRLKSSAITEQVDGGRQNLIVPRQWPITSVTELRIDGARLFTDPSTLVAATDYAVAPEGDSVQLVNGQVFPMGFANVRIQYVGGYLAGAHDEHLANLELACLWMVEWFHRHRHREDMGRTSVGKGDESVGVLASMPPMIREVLEDYKRTEMPGTIRPTRNM